MTRVIADERFRRMWQDGVSSADMAEAFGCKYPTINRVAKVAGLPPRGKRRRRLTRADDDRHLHWLSLRQQGWEWGQIAAVAGQSEGTVRTACHAIRSADLDESGEPAGRVQEGCW